MDGTIDPRQVPMIDTYDDVYYLIVNTISKFKNTYGGDFDDYLGESSIVFMNVYREFNPKLGAFSTLLVRSLWNRFIDLIRREGDYKNHFRTVLDSYSTVSEDTHTLASSLEDHRTDEHGFVFNMKEFAEEMTEDARTVLSLVLESPTEIAQVAEAKGGEPRNWRSTIRNYLYSMNWTADRISETFEEIGMALR